MNNISFYPLFAPLISLIHTLSSFLKDQSLNMPRLSGIRRSLKTELFNYTPLEHSFCFSKNPLGVLYLVKSNSFRKIDPETRYKGKNKEIFITRGELFSSVAIQKIFNSLSLEEVKKRIHIFSIILQNGFMSPETHIRIDEYLSQKRMPRLLRAVCRLILRRHSLCYKQKRVAIMGEFFPRGVDELVNDYTSNL